MMKKIYFQRADGMTLIEAVIYVALMALLLVGTIIFVNGTLIGWRNFRIRDSVESSGSAAMREIVRQIQQAQKIYTPTSVFENTAGGQLSVKTQVGAPSGDTTTYQDFYIDNAVLYQKQEGQNPRQLIPDQVEATGFLLHQVDSSVQIELTLRSKASRTPGGPYQQVFITSATPRGY